jgi:hypothetical protein
MVALTGTRWNILVPWLHEMEPSDAPISSLLPEPAEHNRHHDARRSKPACPSPSSLVSPRRTYARARLQAVTRWRTLCAYLRQNPGHRRLDILRIALAGGVYLELVDGLLRLAVAGGSCPAQALPSPSTCYSAGPSPPRIAVRTR